MGRPAKYPVQEFNGVRYYRKPPGYYKATRGDYMHRDVWRHHNGTIPDGHSVHHVDHDRANNHIGNLELLSDSAHASMHGRLRAQFDPQGTRDRMASIRPSASEWHRSEEGRAWHRAHALRVAASLGNESHVCIRCGKNYLVQIGKRKRGFCSTVCQSAARRASGIDNAGRPCEVCGASFSVNRYCKTRTCSPSCRRKLASPRSSA
jgi:hypothetical protein